MRILSLRQYSGDVLAGLVTTLSLLPAMIIISALVGLPTMNAMLGLLIAVVVYGRFSEVKVQVNAPTTSLAVICMGALLDHGFTGLTMAVGLAGIIQFVLGITNSGRYFRVLPISTLKGIMAGIGVSIVVHELPHLLGVKGYADFMATNFSLDSRTLIFGAGSILLIVAWNRLAPKAVRRVLPGIPVAVLLTILLTFLLQAPTTTDLYWKYAAPFTEWPRNLFRGGIIFYGLSLAFVSSLKSLISTAKLESLTDQNYNMNRELILSGICNMLCGLTGALPVSAHMGPSLIQHEMGAKSRVTSLTLLVSAIAFVFFGSAWLNYLPKETMTALLIYCGFKLVDWQYIASLRRYGRDEWLLAVATASVVVLLDLHYGVFIGLMLTMFRLSATLSADLSCELSRDSQGVETLTLMGAVTFLNLPLLHEWKRKIPNNCHLKIDTAKVYYFDQACIAFFMDWQKQMQQAGGQLIIRYIDLLGHSRFPERQKEVIFAELRKLDRRNERRPGSYGRRKIDALIYDGDEADQDSDQSSKAG